MVKYGNAEGVRPMCVVRCGNPAATWSRVCCGPPAGVPGVLLWSCGPVPRSLHDPLLVLSDDAPTTG